MRARPTSCYFFALAAILMVCVETAMCAEHDRHARSVVELSESSCIVFSRKKREGSPLQLPPPVHRARRSLFSKVDRVPKSGVPPFSKLAMAQSKLPSRLPAPGTAVMVR
jgi:hypothetical protein